MGERMDAERTAFAMYTVNVGLLWVKYYVSSFFSLNLNRLPEDEKAIQLKAESKEEQENHFRGQCIYANIQEHEHWALWVFVLNYFACQFGVRSEIVVSKTGATQEFENSWT